MLSEEGALGFLDTVGDRDGSETDESGEDREGSGGKKIQGTPIFDKQPAWHDKDDAEISVTAPGEHGETIDLSKRLRSQYEKIRGQPEWAKMVPKSKKQRRDSGSDSSSDEDEEGGVLLRRTGNLLKASTEHLPRGFLDLKRMKDANRAKPAAAVVQAVEFHPSANVVLVGGYHKTLDLFQVDGQTNPKLQSIHIPNFPISTAHFSQDGNEVILAGHRHRFYVYDMMAGKITPIHGIRGRSERYWDKFLVSPDNQYLVFLGKDGYLVLVSNKTKQWVGELKMNGNVYDIAFTSDSRYLLSTGSEGKVYVWDMSARECVHVFVDEGCIHGTTIAVSPDSQYVACGSDSGVVNLYRGTECLQAGSLSSPKPVKALMNLTTRIDSLCINPTSELMVISSAKKKSALRVVHLPSQTVFSNWPVKKTPLGYVSSVDISPHSKYMAVGNAKGRVLLYRFNHYSQ